MKRLNGNILIGEKQSQARFENSKNVCQDCYYKLNSYGDMVEFVYWNISNAEYCECCERPAIECHKSGLLIKDIEVI